MIFVFFVADRIEELRITDLKAGTWTVSCGGKPVAEAMVTQIEGTALFRGPSGSYQLTPR